MKNSVIGCSRKQFLLKSLIGFGFFQLVNFAQASPDTASQSVEYLQAIETANGVKYSGGLSEALANNKDKGLDWFSNKAFKLDKSSVINICDPGICYIAEFIGTTPLGIKQINGDFNGRQLQGQIVQIVGVDRYGTIVVARLNDQTKTTKKSNLAKPEKNSNPAQTHNLSQQEARITLEEVISAIKNSAAMGWARPPSTRSGMAVTLQVGMTPDGKISSVNISKSSGDTPFDNSAVAAIKNVGGFTEIRGMNSTEFAPYRAFNMIVTTEDLTF